LQPTGSVSAQVIVTCNQKEARRCSIEERQREAAKERASMLQSLVEPVRINAGSGKARSVQMPRRSTLVSRTPDTGRGPSADSTRTRKGAPAPSRATLAHSANGPSAHHTEEGGWTAKTARGNRGGGQKKEDSGRIRLPSCRKDGSSGHQAASSAGHQRGASTNALYYGTEQTRDCSRQMPERVQANTLRSVSGTIEAKTITMTTGKERNEAARGRFWVKKTSEAIHGTRVG